MFFSILFRFRALILIFIINSVSQCYSNDILGCGGFVKSHASLDFSKIEIGLYTKEGSLKEKTECAPTNGYYFLPLYEKGEYVLRVHPPAGWSFEPSEVELLIDGETDQCSTGEDINFVFNGFGITGRVITAGQKQGPSGINVQLVNEKGDVRNTVTTVGGDFHFTPVIPGKYVVKTTHPRWKLDPAQTVVQVKEGNTALPLGSLSVKGYDVSGSVTSFGSPISGIYVLLYSIEENPKYRVEGCKTALLQGVPDSPICHSITDAAGEFKFGLVPAGNYKLLALSKSPGQAAITYNIKPDAVPFTVKHDSLYIKNAFEVSGFIAVGSVLTGAGGSGISGVRVSMGGQPIGTTDEAGKFTLTGLKPGTFTLNFQHAQCEFDELPVTVTAGGVSTPLRSIAARWKVCGELSPPEPRSVLLRATNRGAPDRRVQAATDGKWCTFLPPGVYAAKVEVSEQEQRDGLQFYPEEQQVSVGRGAVSGVSFGQVRARVRGRVLCDKYCAGLRVALRPLAADGTYAGPPRHAPVVNGEYTFEEVVPGSVEVSVSSDKLCWAESAHNVAVTQELPPVPDFELHGLALAITATHRMQVEYQSKTANGILSVPAGSSRQCVPLADQYTLTPRGCHRVHPPQVTIKMDTRDVPSVSFVATAHAAVIRIVSPEPAMDVVLQLSSDGQPGEDVPLKPVREEAGYVYEHTVYLAEGEVTTVTPQSSHLLFAPRGPQRLVGGSECQPQALTLLAAKALTLKGRIVPSVADVTVTLEGDDVKLSQITGEDGVYSFGPLDATIQYKITAEKDSYVFNERELNGDIRAHKLAEITVQLVDSADDTPLEGALVSVSGGSFRRNVASGPTGSLRFGALSPAQYYVKPNMKEYRFEPPHSIVPVEDGRTHRLVFKGVRVAWSALGRAVSLGGTGVGRVPVRARASPEYAARCPQQDATTSPNGDFRIRGLLPNCVYLIELKESTEQELMGIELAKAPPPLEVKEKDIENIRLIIIQPNQLTDTNVLIHTPNIDHYKTLRLTLALEATPHSSLYSTKLDPTGYNQHNNPGLMHVMPRLPADNKTYVLQLESSLSKVTHSYGEHVYYFNSDGKFRHFDIDFVPKVKSSEQELRQSSLLVLPLLAALGLLYTQRHRLPNLRPDAIKRVSRKKAQ
ncbi:nodal modulator 1 [Maniola jurtina]|uniref:nodal modulator 1 n=1 Tax=Maniola jurtina TaxID=191418 RepID=UPI001E6865E6|nr:nodal modulator 1 [Maniola jurtina]